ncbi:MAG: DsbA family protein, partial [Fimbriimonadaceae bacterium]|nr:DsbA family protein [Alphaproteobacteria bacterium]
GAAAAGTTIIPLGWTPGGFSLGSIDRARAQSSTEAFMVEGPLGEKWLGNPDSDIKVIEYASMTCGHCANFHTNIFPAFKEKYIDTGKVHFLFREFPLDPLAAGAFMLARCAGEDRYFTFVDVLFKTQPTWTRTNDPVTALFNISRQAGFTQETFDTCLSNQRLLDGVNWVKDRGETEFNVRSTPTFFVNGQMLRGVQSLEELEAAIDKAS